MKINPSMAVVATIFLKESNAFNPSSNKSQLNRKHFLGNVVGTVLISPLPSFAKAQVGPTAQEDISVIRDASSTLNILLDNWEKATVECIYADVPRELLESKNKQQLLEKASTFALFDKSVSVVSCKMTNKKVRDYIGVTGKGPLVNVDKRMLKRTVAEFVDPDDLESYYSEVENFSRSISRASTASYAAGMSDLDSINNFEKGTQNEDSDSNLDQAKRAIQEAKESCEKIVFLLDKNET